MDNDNFSDYCDAFPENDTEWVDFDGDSYGGNYDCDDFNPLITVECYETNETDDDDDGGKGGGSGETFCTAEWECTEWSSCDADDMRIRTCTKTNDCDDESNKPDEEWACPEVKGLSLSPQGNVAPVIGDGEGETESNETTEEPDDDDKGLGDVTGQAFNVLWTGYNFFGLLMLILIIFLLFLFFKKRKKEQDKIS